MRLYVVSVVLSVGLASAAAAEVPLSTFDFTGTGSTAAGPFTTASPFVSYGDPSGMNPAGFLGNAPISLLDILQGNEFELTGDFAGFAAAMTNGLDQPMYVGFTAAGGVGDSALTVESSLLSFGPVIGSPDLAGYTITRVVVLGSSFSQLAGGEFEFGMNFTVFGEVPAPGAAGLLAIAGVFAARRRRR